MFLLLPNPTTVSALHHPHSRGLAALPAPWMRDLCFPAAGVPLLPGNKAACEECARESQTASGALTRLWRSWLGPDGAQHEMCALNLPAQTAAGGAGQRIPLLSSHSCLIPHPFHFDWCFSGDAPKPWGPQRHRSWAKPTAESSPPEDVMALAGQSGYVPQAGRWLWGEEAFPWSSSAQAGCPQTLVLELAAGTSPRMAPIPQGPTSTWPGWRRAANPRQRGQSRGKED